MSSGPASPDSPVETYDQPASPDQAQLSPDYSHEYMAAAATASRGSADDGAEVYGQPQSPDMNDFQEDLDKDAEATTAAAVAGDGHVGSVSDSDSDGEGETPAGEPEELVPPPPPAPAPPAQAKAVHDYLADFPTDFLETDSVSSKHGASDAEDDGGHQEPPTKRHRAVLSDDEDTDEVPTQETGKEGDDDDEDGEEEHAPSGDLGSLMANIFGDESDVEGEGGQGDYDQRSQAGDPDEDRIGKEWDFDRIMAEKKKERSKKKRRHKDGSIDLCSNADGQIRHIVELMKSAAAEDREANVQRRPAIRKTKMLEIVRTTLLKADFFEALLENDMMSAMSEWLAPLPDKSLPALVIRSTFLKILASFPHLEPGILKQSGLGKAVMLIYKHPKETSENKKIASKLIRTWSQPIFQTTGDFSRLSRDEREAFDFDHLPESKKRRISAGQRMNPNAAASSSKSSEIEDSMLGPGDPGFVNRARVPRASTSAYVIRPKPNVDVQFRGPSKGSSGTRYDRTQRSFKERTRSSKAQRAVGVSIEGRHMDI